MKIKTLNQKSKIALFAVILVALIGLVLSVGSIVHAQEATQEEGTTSATETVQPATTYNDANSLLGNSEGTTVNEDIEVTVDGFNWEIYAKVVDTPPSGWTPTGTEPQIEYTKNFPAGTPVASIKSEWSQRNIKSEYVFDCIYNDSNNVLLSSENKDFDIEAYELEDESVTVRDDQGTLLEGVLVKSLLITASGNPEQLVATTDSSGKADVKVCARGSSRIDLSKEGYVNCSVLGFNFSRNVTMQKISSEKKYLNLNIQRPTSSLIKSDPFGPCSVIEFSDSLDLEKKHYQEERTSYYYLNTVDTDGNENKLVAYSGSSYNSQMSFYFLGDDGSLTKMDEDTKTTIDKSANLLCVATYSNKNLIVLPGSDKFTFTFKWTIGDTEYVDTTANELYQYIDPKMKFTVKGNVIEGINENPTNDDAMADKVQIIANPNSGYVLKNWQQDGEDIEDGATFEMTTNTIFAFTAVAEEAPVTAHQLTINYKFEDGSQAATTYTGTLNEGESYAVTSPAVEGYTPDIATVEGTMGTEDITENVTYKANGGGGGDVPGGGGTSSDSAVTSGTSSSSTGDFNSSAVMAIMGLVALAGGFAIAGRKKFFNR